jgi:tetratricopeptide (TPR) repeat protein
MKDRPKQPEVLIMKARWDGLRGKPDKAMEAYEMVVKMDNKRVTNMEKYAAALRDAREGEKLRILAQRLFEINENSCESWIASAMASDLSKEKEKALSFAQKARDLNPRNQVALVTLGEFALKVK